jgi:hypothetical protein
MKQFLRGLSYGLGVSAGFSFVFGGVLLQALGNMEWLLAQMLGIGIALVCLVGAGSCRYFIDDIEWQEANEEAAAALEGKIEP